MPWQIPKPDILSLLKINELSESVVKDNSRITRIYEFLRSKREQSYVVRQIKESLKRGEAARARRLAMEGTQRYQTHHDLQEFARVLAPPRIINNNVPSMPSIRANHTWLTAHRKQYQGHWIALRNGELVGMADSLDALVQKVGRTNGVLLTKA